MAVHDEFDSILNDAAFFADFTPLIMAVDVMVSGLPQVLKVWLGISRVMLLPVRTSAPPCRNICSSL